jgi:hypothetical protein
VLRQLQDAIIQPSQHGADMRTIIDAEIGSTIASHKSENGRGELAITFEGHGKFDVVWYREGEGGDIEFAEEGVVASEALAAFAHERQWDLDHPQI